MVRLLKKYIKGYGVITILGIVFKFLEAVIELIIPLVVAKIVDTGIEELGDLNYVISRGMLMLLLYISGFALAVTCQYFAAKSAFGFGTNLRRTLYGHINMLPLQDAERLGTPTLLTRLSLDINNVQNTLNRVIRLVSRAPFVIVGSLIISVIINPTLSLAFFGAAILLSLSLFLIMRFSTSKLKKINLKHDEVTLLTKENLSGARVVRAFNKQAEEEADFKKTSDGLKKQSILLGLITSLSSPLTYMIINSAVIFLVYVGAFQVNSGNLEKGQIIALGNYLMQILNSMLVMALLINFFTKGSVSSKRINDILKLPAENEEGIDASCLFCDKTDKNESLLTDDSNNNTENLIQTNTSPIIKNTDKAVVFKNVCMSYGGNSGQSLKNISFTLKQGQTLGIIGSTGSGKTTLVSLIAKLFAYDGDIEFFGLSLKELSAKSVRQAVAYAPQKAILFSGSVRDNLLMSNPDASDEDMLLALKAAACGFISSLDAVVARGGANFSGGQRQRLCIARALIKKSPILVLDDSTSALDYSTEAEIKKHLNLMTDVTKIIVTQRVGSIKNADLILVLEEGETVGLGIHNDLLNTCPVYKEINDIQGGTL